MNTRSYRSTFVALAVDEFGADGLDADLAVFVDPEGFEHEYGQVGVEREQADLDVVALGNHGQMVSLLDEDSGRTAAVAQGGAAGIDLDGLSLLIGRPRAHILH